MTGKSAVFLKMLGDAVHQAMVESMGVSPLDRFQVITGHTPATLYYDASYLGIERTDEIIIIQITLNEGRTVDTKRTFYQRTVQLLEQSLKDQIRGCDDRSGGRSKRKIGRSVVALPNMRHEAACGLGAHGHLHQIS